MAGYLRLIIATAHTPPNCAAALHALQVDVVVGEVRMQRAPSRTANATSQTRSTQAG
jgi:hypothetical protein